MFSVGQKGFRIVFDNGWTISVQWGPGNYCKNRVTGIYIDSDDYPECKDAEVGIWYGEQSPHTEMEIHGWQSPKEVAGHIMQVALRAAKDKAA